MCSSQAENGYRYRAPERFVGLAADGSTEGLFSTAVCVHDEARTFRLADLHHTEIRRPEAFIMTPVWFPFAVSLCFPPLRAWE